MLPGLTRRRLRCPCWRKRNQEAPNDPDSVLTGDDGTVTHLRKGDAFIIRSGFTGTWEVLETTLKDYVILERP